MPTPAIVFIRRVGRDGLITTVAGNSSFFLGDLTASLPATESPLFRPTGVTLAPDGSLYIADQFLHRIRQVSPDGLMHTAAGTGARGYSGDGDAATQAQLAFPTAVTLAADGTLYIADAGNSRIRRVSPDGRISTVAGIGISGFGGDGGPALEARLAWPTGMALAANGTLYIADVQNHRIRRVRPDGRISTVAGTGQYGFSGDGGPAMQAALASPTDVALAPDGSIDIADTDNGRIRRLRSSLPTFVNGEVAIASPTGALLYYLTRPGDIGARWIR